MSGRVVLDVPEGRSARVLIEDLRHAWDVIGNGRLRDLADQIETQSARPLVVIDPEDREQIERLDDIYQKALDGAPKFHSLADVMQAALREFANPTPPKPDEPTGLGAVVEDRDGIRWVRSLRADVEFSTPWRDCNDDHFARHYDAIEAVRVLSEGIQ